MESSPKNLTEVIDLIIDGIKDGEAALADGKVDFLDAMQFSNLLPELIPAVQGLDQIPGEISHLDLAAGEALVAHVVERLGIINVKAVAIINASLKLIGAVKDLVVAIKS